jgi:hypothetical protein
VALIGGGNEPAPKLHSNCRPGVQRYLQYLESTVRGTPGMAVENPEPFQIREEAQLIDGPAVQPKPSQKPKLAPSKPRRKRQRVKAEDLEPRRDVALQQYCRRLKGQK